MTGIKVAVWDADGVLFPYELYPMDPIKFFNDISAEIVQRLFWERRGEEIERQDAFDYSISSLDRLGHSMAFLYEEHDFSPHEVHAMFMAESLARLEQDHPDFFRACPYLGYEFEKLSIERPALQNVVLTHGCEHNWVRPLSESLGYARYIDRVFGFSAIDFKLKSSGPDAFLIVAKALNVEPHEMVMIEDTIANLLPAKALGMKTVFITGGDETKWKPEYAAFVDAVFERPADFLKAWREKGDALFPDERRSSIFVPRQPAIVTSLTPS